MPEVLKNSELTAMIANLENDVHTVTLTKYQLMSENIELKKKLEDLQYDTNKKAEVEYYKNNAVFLQKCYVIKGKKDSNGKPMVFCRRCLENDKIATVRVFDNDNGDKYCGCIHCDVRDEIILQDYSEWITKVDKKIKRR
jgi:hypothetical protein